MKVKYSEKFKDSVDRGLKGKNIGITMGLPRLEEHIYGIQPGIYTLLFGKTGCGKTSVALYSYIYRPLMDMISKGKPFKIIYFSLEMTGEMLLAKLASIYILETYGIQLGYKEIFSKKEILNPEHVKLVYEAIKWTEMIEKYLIIYDKSLNAESLYAFLKTFAEENGRFEEGEHSEIYIANDPEETVLVIGDHLGLVRRNKGRSKKEEIDLVSTYLLYFRNKCKYAILALMQVNRDQSSMDRRNANLMEPTLEDIKDSGCPSEDAEIVLAIFNPFKEKLSRHRNYDIKQLRDRARFICVLKNRYGDSDQVVPLAFYGKCNYVRELPELDGEGKDDDSNLDYQSFKNPLWKDKVERKNVVQHKNITFTL